MPPLMASSLPGSASARPPPIGQPKRGAFSKGSAPAVSEPAVAQLVASGLYNRQAAERFTVSLRAIEFHPANIYAKLQVSFRSQLAAGHDFQATLGPASGRKS